MDVVAISLKLTSPHRRAIPVKAAEHLTVRRELCLVLCREIISSLARCEVRKAKNAVICTMPSLPALPNAKQYCLSVKTPLRIICPEPAITSTACSIPRRPHLANNTLSIMATRHITSATITLSTHRGTPPPFWRACRCCCWRGACGSGPPFGSGTVLVG